MKFEAVLSRTGFGSVKLDGKDIACSYFNVEAFAGEGIKVEIHLPYPAINLDLDVDKEDVKIFQNESVKLMND
jgi:hypothetical protein